MEDGLIKSSRTLIFDQKKDWQLYYIWYNIIKEKKQGGRKNGKLWMRELRKVIVMRRRRFITKKEYREKMKEIELFLEL